MLDTMHTKSIRDGAKGAKEASKHVQARVRPSGAAADSEMLAQDMVGSVRPQQQGDANDGRIQTLRGVQRNVDKLWGAEFFGAIGGTALGWVATKTKKDKFAAVVRAIFVAPFEALRETRLNNIPQFPAIYMSKVAEHSHSIGGKAEGWAHSANAKAASLQHSASQLSEKIHSHTSAITEPVHSAVGNGLRSFGETSVGGHVLGGFQKFANWRSETNTAKHLKQLSKAEAALTQKPPGLFGFVERIGRFFTGKAPKDIGTHSGLSSVTSHLSNARNAATSAERALHMEHAEKAAKLVIQGTDEELAARAGHVLKYIEKSNVAANAAHHMEHAATQDLAGVAKSLVKGLGRTRLFGGVIALGVAAGLTATVMTHKKETVASREAHAEIVAAIGNDNPLMQSIDKAYSKGKGNHALKTSLSVVSDVANGAMAASPAAGGVGYMAAAMLPAGVSMLIKENLVLNAYANLRQEEKLGLQMEPAVKLTLLRQLVGSVPTVAANGGIYNRLTMPVAEAILDKHLTAKETMQLLANQNEFSALATDVLEKQKALSAAVSAGVAEKAAAPAEAAPVISMTGSPTAKLSQTQHEGRVVSLHKAAAV